MGVVDPFASAPSRHPLRRDMQCGAVAGQLAAAWGVGWAIGTEVGQLIEEYDPSLYTAIGASVASQVDYIYSQLPDWAKAGEAIQYLGQIFNHPPGIGMQIGYEESEETAGGDYAVSADWEQGYDTGWGGSGVSCWPFECMMK